MGIHWIGACLHLKLNRFVRSFLDKLDGLEAPLNAVVYADVVYADVVVVVGSSESTEAAIAD